MSDNVPMSYDDLPLEERLKMFARRNGMTGLGHDIFIDDDGSIITTDVTNFSNQLWVVMPFNFKESGSFNCSHNPITTLEGAPKKVNGNFRCIKTKITNLTGGPEWVEASYEVYSTETLVSAKGFPKFVGGEVKIELNSKPEACIPLLFAEIYGPIKIMCEPKNINCVIIEEILEMGRVRGKMPRELIPGKINELRDLT
jgi:hypothetical protein